jgi:2-polyprenyl-3-methyl-5-hydroxy-6-metoxy-1,4-benzoquinol methylase
LILRCGEHSLEWVDAPVATDVGAIEGALEILYGRGGSDASTRRVGRLLDLVEGVARPPGVLHDHGCGNGQLMRQAALRGWTAQGNDLVATPVAALAAEGMRYFRSELRDLHLEAACDVVTSYCVLPHVSDPLAELRAIRLLLRPGGWVVAEMPSNGLYRRTVHALHSASLGRWQWILGLAYAPTGHRFAFDPMSARRAMERAGFRNIRVAPFRHDPADSARRFVARPRWFRIVAMTAITVLDRLSRSPGTANHIVAIGQR